MNIWWDSLLPLGRFFYLIAIPSTLVLLIQFVMSLLGLSHDTDLDVQNLDGHVDFNLDHDFDISDGHEVFSADFQFISFRSIIAFLTIFSWTGIVMMSNGSSTILTMVVSVAAGLLAMFVIGYLFFLATKLQSSGNISYQNAVGSTAEVYIPINENTNFQGKVQVVVQERLIEASAITKNKKGFSTGEIVQVVGLVGLSTLVVDELSPEK
jgi:membrane protein implicated in regulation of membrane protease activity